MVSKQLRATVYLYAWISSQEWCVCIDQSHHAQAANAPLTTSWVVSKTALTYNIGYYIYSSQPTVWASNDLSQTSTWSSSDHPGKLPDSLTVRVRHIRPTQSDSSTFYINTIKVGWKSKGKYWKFKHISTFCNTQVQTFRRSLLPPSSHYSLNNNNDSMSSYASYKQSFYWSTVINYSPQCTVIQRYSCMRELW